MFFNCICNPESKLCIFCATTCHKNHRVSFDTSNPKNVKCSCPNEFRQFCVAVTQKTEFVENKIQIEEEEQQNDFEDDYYSDEDY